MADALNNQSNLTPEELRKNIEKFATKARIRDTNKFYNQVLEKYNEVLNRKIPQEPKDLTSYLTPFVDFFTKNEVASTVATVIPAIGAVVGFANLGHNAAINYQKFYFHSEVAGQAYKDSLVALQVGDQKKYRELVQLEKKHSSKALSSYLLASGEVASLLPVGRGALAANRIVGKNAVKYGKHLVDKGTPLLNKIKKAASRQANKNKSSVFSNKTLGVGNNKSANSSLSGSLKNNPESVSSNAFKQQNIAQQAKSGSTSSTSGLKASELVLPAALLSASQLVKTDDDSLSLKAGKSAQKVGEINATSPCESPAGSEQLRITQYPKIPYKANNEGCHCQKIINQTIYITTKSKGPKAIIRELRATAQ